jgi:hypothetical protein
MNDSLAPKNPYFMGFPGPRLCRFNLKINLLAFGIVLSIISPVIGDQVDDLIPIAWIHMAVAVKGCRPLFMA